MSFSTDGYVEAQKRALIHIVCFALNAGIFGVAALNVTLCNPCFLRRMCILAPHGISDLIHEFARCESRTSYRELVVVFRAWMKVRGHDGAARSHYQRGMLMVERGREQRKGHVEFEKEKRKAFEKTFEETATLSTLATQSGGGNGAQGGHDPDLVLLLLEVIVLFMAMQVVLAQHVPCVLFVPQVLPVGRSPLDRRCLLGIHVARNPRVSMVLAE